MAVVDNVDISVGMSTGRLNKGAQRAAKILSRFRGGIGRLQGAIHAVGGPATIGVAVALGVVAKAGELIYDRFKEAGQAMLDAGKAARKMGVSVESITGGLFTGNQVLAVENLSRAWGRLQGQVTRIFGSALAALAPKLQTIVDSLADMASLISNDIVNALTEMANIPAFDALYGLAKVYKGIRGSAFGKSTPEFSGKFGEGGGGQFAGAAARGSQDAISAINRAKATGNQPNPKEDVESQQLEVLSGILSIARAIFKVFNPAVSLPSVPF